MFSKPFFLTYVKQKTEVRKKKWLSGSRLFPNQLADTVIVPSGRQHPSEKKDGGQWLSGHGPLMIAVVKKEVSGDLF